MNLAMQCLLATESFLSTQITEKEYRLRMFMGMGENSEEKQMEIGQVRWHSEDGHQPRNAFNRDIKHQSKH